jgi:hypothetical protein
LLLAAGSPKFAASGTVRVALFPDIDVDQRVADGLTVESTSISGATADVKSP